MNWISLIAAAFGFAFALFGLIWYVVSDYKMAKRKGELEIVLWFLDQQKSR